MYRLREEQAACIGCGRLFENPKENENEIVEPEERDENNADVVVDDGREWRCRPGL